VFKLILKDYSTQKAFFGIYGSFAIVLSILYGYPFVKTGKLSDDILTQNSVIAVFIYIPIYLLINYLFYQDYKYDAMKLILTFPLNRKQIVFSKYLSSLMLLIMPVLVFVIFSGIYRIALPLSGELFFQKLITLGSFSLAFLIMFSINLPWYFKYDYDKAIYFNGYISTIIFFIISPFLVLRQLDNGILPEFFQNTISRLPKVELTSVVFLLFVSSGLLFISIKLSEHISVRKEI